MTIAVAIKTGSAVIFAADSKLTTQGFGGFDDKGEIIWRDQTYDSVYKIAHDRNLSLMAMAAGSANIGRTLATDFIMRYSFSASTEVDQQDKLIQQLAVDIEHEIVSFWNTTKVPQDEWGGPSLWLAAAAPNQEDSRVWHGRFTSPQYSFEEVLKSPGIELDGSYREVYSLLYGMDWGNFEEIQQQLKITDEQLFEAIKNSRLAQVADKINFWSMPTQDAVDLTVFLANVQIQMDRFLPGEAVCGGPIDVMILQMTPNPAIIPYLKALHYPKTGG
jgi:hypothetical protein